MRIGNREFDTKNQNYIMGILNVTPDSFSDGGKWNSYDAALRHAQEMIGDGAAIIDVGGESTRPGYTRISDQEEIERVVPVIELLKKHFDTPISVDTYKSRVAEAALKAGADLINDIWGLKADEKLAEVIQRYEVPCCLMHNRNEENYTSFWRDMTADLKETLEIAARAGIPDDRIILDPGVGFGKTHQQNLTVVNHLEKLHELGYPILLGTSRKRIVGFALDLPADQRVEGTLVTTVFGVLKGAAFFRVHDVKENVRAVKMARAILEGNEVE
ncbi:MAG TPA: dihydropteroate synthase [Candidatus Limivivens intestinipullorum]|uniref:Dihydropteroate synthase n=1 Tax=Candidatus Limivivens intestinipullorum TaxID=2840858 RepID=A0A9D1JL57_9FIRM|nr:dihydropteroate synthase [Candidatus Limivivens intestinipullorum]